MKKLLYLLICICGSAFSQNNYINDDGTMSDFAKRQLLVETFKSNQTEDIQYDAEDDYFVIISKYDCESQDYEPTEMQKNAMIHCFGQLLNNITSLQKRGFELFSDINFKGIIFKTNTICMYKTRRYHFKFTFNELEQFPEYIDFEELFNYVTVQKQNSNIIYVKNER